MAVRLPVVVSQHISRQSCYTDAEESLVTLLLFENGLDATLIGPLSQISLDSTDHLCIQGLKGDFVLVNWDASQDSLVQLARLGLAPVDVVPMSGASKLSSQTESNPAKPKRVYHYEMKLGMQTEATIAELKKLLQQISVPLVSLGAPKQRVAQPSLTVVLAPPTTITPAPPPPPAATHVASQAPSSKRAGYEQDFPEIDALFDELNSTEL
jgi:hypothetical protein